MPGRVEEAIGNNEIITARWQFHDEHENSSPPWWRKTSPATIQRIPSPLHCVLTN